MTATARSVVLAARPKGAPTLDDFRLEAAPVPEPGPGRFLARVVWLSLDPYMRGRMDDARSYAAPAELGAPMPGEGVAEVVASGHPGFAAGDVVAGPFGWTTHVLSDAAGVRRLDDWPAPLQTALGVLGMPGHTAWLSLTAFADARPGETIVVSAATGAVGSLLGQLARLRGLTAVGIAGGPEKCAFATAELGYHACLDHRAAPDAAALSAALAEAAPDGVDVYHDNTGARPLAAVLPLMNPHGRVTVCGTVGWFAGQGADDPPPLPGVWRTILTRRLTVRGLLVFDHAATRDTFLAEVAPLVPDGRIRYRETVAEGLEAAPAALLAMLAGGNLGKQLVRVGADPAR